MSARRLTFLFWIAFAVLIAAVLWVLLAACGLTWAAGRPLIVFCPIEAAGRTDPALAAEQERQRALERAVRDLEIALLDRPYCPPADAPEQQAQVEPAPEPEPEPEPQPEPEPEPEREEEQAEPLEPCPQRRPTEVVLVLDASNSMNWDFDLDPAVEQRIIAVDERARQLAERINELQQSGDLFGLMAEIATLQQEHQTILQEREILDREVDDPAKVNRIDVARQALTDVVQTAPEDLVFGLVSFNACGAPQRHGHFAPDERDRLLHRLGIIELGDYTALADTIASLPQIIRGGQSAEDPVNIVLVSDGKDSCGGDPCAAAAALKAAAPHAYVNVIAIGRNAEEARCVADATGGAFLQAEDAGGLTEQLVHAAGQDLPEHCR